MSLLFKAPFTSQPQGAVEIDWGNPLNNSLAVSQLGSNPVNLASGKVATSTSGVPEVSRTGLALRYNKAASRSTRYDIAPVTFPFTLVAEVYAPGDSASGVILSVGNGTASALMMFRGDASNVLQAAIWDGSAFRSCNSASQLRIGVPQIVAVRFYNSLNFDTYLNGVVSSLLASDQSVSLPQSARVYVGGSTNSLADGFNGLVGFAEVFNRALSDAELRRLSDNPYQLFKPKSRTLWIPSTAAPAGHTLTAATTAQSSSSSPGSITQSHTLSGSATNQSATSGTGAITHGTTHVLTAASSTQSSASTTGAVTQSHTLTGAASSQSAGSSTGAVIAGFVHVLTGATSSQSAASSTGAITQSHVLVCAPSVQDSIASASAIVQAHVLAAGGCNQLAVSGVGAIWSGVELPFDPSIYVAASPVVSYLATSPAQSYSVTAPAKNYSA